MRLSKVDRGQDLKSRIALTAIGWLTGGGHAPDVIRVLKYRPQLFGDHFSLATQHAMRGPSRWSAGQREMVAALVSSRNHCLF